MAKTVISEINLKNLKKVPKTDSTEELFRFFYENLYHEDVKGYNYGKFKKVAFGTQVSDF